MSLAVGREMLFMRIVSIFSRPTVKSGQDRLSAMAFIGCTALLDNSSYT